MSYFKREHGDGLEVDGTRWLNTATDDDSGEDAPSAIEQLRKGQLTEVRTDARHAAASWNQ